MIPVNMTQSYAERLIIKIYLVYNINYFIFESKLITMEDSNNLTSEESLKIITRMITTAKGNIKGSSFHFLLWGWVVAIGNLGHFALMQYSTFDKPYYIWFITIPAWITSMLYGYRQSKNSRVSTYSDGLIMWLWLSFTFSIVIMIFSGHFNEKIPMLMLLFAGTATFMTGMILKFKPLIIGGSSFWIFAVICFIVGPVYSLLVSAVAVVFGYLIPGYKLRNA
jgi:predicted neutral ceramidase superfamily lipid hydrolase